MKFSFTNSDVSKFVGLGRLEKYTIGQIMQGVKVFFSDLYEFLNFWQKISLLKCKYYTSQYSKDRSSSPGGDACFSH